MARKQISASGDFVTVACKLPQGLLVKLPAIGEQRERTVKLHGRHSPYAVADHGMTQVKADTWAEIQMVYADAKWLENEHVFAMKDPDSASDKADDRKAEDAGFNPIDPNDPNAGRGIGVKIEPTIIEGQ